MSEVQERGELLQEQIAQLIDIIKSRKDISTFPEMNQFLKDKWLKSVVLKKQRSSRKRMNFDDSYILGVLTEDKKWIAIKIHPDKYVDCREIYNNPDWMKALIEDGDIPLIYDTFVHRGSRVVLYEWSRYPTVKYIKDKSPLAHEFIQTAISRRILSLVKKWFFPTEALEAADMIYHPEGTVTITDINKISSKRKRDDMSSLDNINV